MGTRTVRFTPADFVKTVEFKDLELSNSPTGQIGGVSLSLVNSGGKTRIGDCFQQTPMRVFPAFHFAGEPASLVYLINPTAGLMDGDGHLMEINAGPGTRCVVTGQSATRVHPALSRYATQQWRIRVAAGAELVILPGPNIPFEGSRYHQHVEIDLEGDARLIWADIWTPGRYDRDELSERYSFSQIVQHLEIRRDGDLVFRDRFHWTGPWDADAIAWHMGGNPVNGAGGIFATGDISALFPEKTGPAHSALMRTAAGDSVIRTCGLPSEILVQTVEDCLRIAAGWTPEAELSHWLVTKNHLGPSHWFPTTVASRSSRDES